LFEFNPKFCNDKSNIEIIKRHIDIALSNQVANEYFPACYFCHYLNTKLEMNENLDDIKTKLQTVFQNTQKLFLVRDEEWNNLIARITDPNNRPQIPMRNTNLDCSWQRKNMLNLYPILG
jgi:hypothetical protein